MFELGIMLIIAIITVSIANQNGRSPLFWGVLSLFLPIIALIILCCLPNLKVCPQCGKRVLRIAKKCRYCFYRFDGEGFVDDEGERKGYDVNYAHTKNTEEIQ
jgi:hypothetical protein